MSDSNKKPLEWYEENVQEIKLNPDGSVTFVFDEPAAPGDVKASTSSTTISKEEYEKALSDPAYLI